MPYLLRRVKSQSQVPSPKLPRRRVIARTRFKEIGMSVGKATMVVVMISVLSSCSVITRKIDRMTGYRQAQELEKTGQTAEATILEIRDSGITVNNDPVVDFVLEVRPEGKEAYKAKTRMRISRIEIPQFQPGALVQVNYDPNNPARVSFNLNNH